MKFNDKKRKLDLLLELIQKGRARNTKELSIKLDVSSRTVRRCIDELRDQGYPISFITDRNGFYLIDNKSPQK